MLGKISARVFSGVMTPGWCHMIILPQAGVTITTGCGKMIILHRAGVGWKQKLVFSITSEKFSQVTAIQTLVSKRSEFRTP